MSTTPPISKNKFDRTRSDSCFCMGGLLNAALGPVNPLNRCLTLTNGHLPPHLCSFNKVGGGGKGVSSPGRLRAYPRHMGLVVEVQILLTLFLLLKNTQKPQQPPLQGQT